MALKREEWSLRVGYVEELVRRGAIELKELPGAPGVWVVTESRKVGIACKPHGVRHPWTRNDRRIPVGSLLVRGWRCIRSPDSLDFFDTLARRTKIPNVWIEMPGYKLLLCCLHVDDLPALERMQEHIIDEEGTGYQDEQARLMIALKELEELNLILPDELKNKNRQILAQTLAHIETLFDRCFLPEKAGLTQFASGLRQKIIIIYRRFQFEKNLMQQVEAIKRRQDQIGQISPFFSARQRAAEETTSGYQRKLASAQRMADFYLGQLIEDKINQRPATITGALRAMTDNLKQEILCRPARAPARRAAYRMERAAKCWGKNDNWGSPISPSQRHLAKAIRQLQIAQRKLRDQKKLG